MHPVWIGVGAGVRVKKLIRHHVYIMQHLLNSWPSRGVRHKHDTSAKRAPHVCALTKGIHIAQMTLGFLFLLNGVTCFLPNPLLLGTTPWQFGIIHCLYGAFAIHASTLYNPCGCCTDPKPGQAKIISISSALSALMAVVGIIVGAVIIAQANADHWAREGTMEKYTCCPAGSTSVTDACNEPDCSLEFPGNCWAERMSCTDGFVGIAEVLEDCPEFFEKNGRPKCTHYNCCPTGATEITASCSTDKCNDLAHDCLLGPKTSCSSGKVPMLTGELGSYGDTVWGKGEKNFITGKFLYWALPWYVMIILAGCAAAGLTLNDKRILADFER